MTELASKPVQRYEAPKESGSALVVPSLVSTLAGRSNWLLNRSGDEESSSASIELCGKPIESVRREARAEAIALARKYTRDYRDVEEFAHPGTMDVPILMAGHQPELFHPGVWFKNYLLAESAKKLGCIALNFVVDNDLCRAASIKVPTRAAAASENSSPTSGAPGYDNSKNDEADHYSSIHLETVSWDAAREPIPWECRGLGDIQVFDSFPDRVRKTLLPEIEHPAVERLWTHARQAIQRTRLVGTALAQARHALEGELGLQTLELPLSQLTSTRSFARFSLQVLNELPRFQQVYNSRRESYRRVNRVRSDAHPVPALQQRRGWLEAPLWIYREEFPKRQRLFACYRDDYLLLSDQCGWQATIEGPLDSERAIDQWMDILADDTYLRPRALLTTMFARMIVGDVFVHGIGGGKYDELTDAILTEFFGCDAPPLIVASATMRLPVTPPSMTEEVLRRARERSWELKFHGDQFIDSQPVEAERLRERKRQLLQNVPQRGQKWEWHRQITEVNRRLAELGSAEATRLREFIEHSSAQLRQRRLLESREMSFCLFPFDWLADQLKSLAARYTLLD